MTNVTHFEGKMDLPVYSLLFFPTVLTFALMMQSKEGKTTGNLVLVKSVAPNSSGHRHFPFQADLRMSVMKLLS